MRIAGYSISTRQAYARTLRDVQDHFHALADVLTSEELFQYLSEREKIVGSSTLNTNACALKYYFQRVLAKPRPVATIPTVRQTNQLGELLTTSEVGRLLAAAAGPKHRAVIGLLFGLGLRAGEVASIRLHDFDRDRKTLTIHKAKGGKDRVLPYDESIRRVLIPYFRADKPTDYLFTSSTRPAAGEGMSKRGIQYIVRVTLEASGIKKHICPHTLRHCFAVQYLNQGGNIMRLQQLLGHATINSTMRYLSYANPELKDVASPLAFVLGA